MCRIAATVSKRRHFSIVLGTLPNPSLQLLLSATIQRLIARSNRISLPRAASAHIRLERLRRSLCHARTVRVTYFALPPDAQAALQRLRSLRCGITRA